MQSQFKRHTRILFGRLPILIICAWIQCASFSGVLQDESWYRYHPKSDYAETYEEALQKSTDIGKEYGEALVGTIDIYYEYKDYYPYKFEKWVIDYIIDQWFNNDPPPKLSDLLSRTAHAPLIISTIVLLLILSVFSIEKDYRPNKNVLTLLRLPQPRSRYLLSKLIAPVSLMFLFWGLQFLVVILQSAHYFSAVPEAVRPINQSPWVFDFYRILYPVVEPIWFPATVCTLCMIPLVIVTIMFIAKGGMKSWIYGILPIIGAAAVLMVINRIPNMWWIMPTLLVAVWSNGMALINKGQIVQ